QIPRRSYRARDDQFVLVATGRPECQRHPSGLRSLHPKAIRDDISEKECDHTHALLERQDGTPSLTRYLLGRLRILSRSSEITLARGFNTAPPPATRDGTSNTTRWSLNR